jgi:pSer/pThr/pTyr-binding forkhead associated (FHA) protein
MAALKVVQGEGLAQDFPLLSGVTIIGRGVQCDVVLQHLAVSRQHARITRTSAGYSIEDLGSRNGVMVNGHLITGPTALGNADTVQICNFVFSFVLRPSHELMADAVGI